MKSFKIMVILLVSLLLLSGCGNIDDAEPSPILKNTSSEKAALAAYSSPLSGDRTLMDDTQAEMWIPEFQTEGMAYEYTYLDLDGDGVVELNEVSQTIFDERLDILVTSRMLNRSDWTSCISG